MTSNDAPTPGARPPRRRTLGRGPGATPEEGAGIPTAPSPEVTPRGTASEPGPAARPSPGAFEGAARASFSDTPGEPDGEASAEVPAVVGPEAAPEDGAAGCEGPGPVDAAPLASPAGADEPVTPPKGAVAGSGEPGPRTPGRPSPVDPVGASERGTAVSGETGPGAGPVSVGRADAASRPGEPLPGAPPAREAVVGTVARASAPAADAGEDTDGAEPAGGVPRAGAGEDDDGRFTVRLANFEGPFDLLLQLISKRKLDVTEVALSEVTDEFTAHIRAMGPDWDLDETTEFLVVAATLLDLKAARLLPAAEVEDEADLALLEARDLLFARLLQYRAYKRIAEIFSRRLDDEGRRHPRTVGLEPHHAELLPEVVIGIGPEGFAGLAAKAMQPRPKPQVYVDHIHAPLVSVREQAGIVVARLRELGEAGFRALVEDTDDTLTVVARFLALLELYREKAVGLDQETALGELTVRWTGGDGDAVPAVTDEFDRPPERPEEERTP
ncbi:chromosome segregation protein ScpA [Streptomyces caelestis]|uniref:Segregation and condensation protein A n=1 Tax=Streptomyces caelestis TaxID=36816 RepID=A0A0M8QWB2_9ACTN|nr:MULTISPECIES: segregation/condensation protein A [Streptomyces]KOT46464.1 chromosome segregation protein ScpA [Streptomyces caelestis]KOV22028.1 chromosome segregation protein ScpA [Streptomyces sp. XY152]